MPTLKSKKRKRLCSKLEATARVSAKRKKKSNCKLKDANSIKSYLSLANPHVDCGDLSYESLAEDKDIDGAGEPGSKCVLAEEIPEMPSDLNNESHLSMAYDPQADCKSAEACLISAQTLSLILERLNSLEILIQEFLMEIRKSSISLGEKDKEINIHNELPEPPTNLMTLGMEPFKIPKPSERGNKQLTWLPTAIVIGIPFVDGYLWTSKNKISRALSELLKRDIHHSAILDFFYLPSSCGFKRLFLTCSSSKLVHHILRSRHIFQSFNLNIQRVFKQGDNQLLFGEKKASALISKSCSMKSKLDQTSPSILPLKDAPKACTFSSLRQDNVLVSQSVPNSTFGRSGGIVEDAVKKPPLVLTQKENEGVDSLLKELVSLLKSYSPISESGKNMEELDLEEVVWPVQSTLKADAIFNSSSQLKLGMVEGSSLGSKPKKLMPFLEAQREIMSREDEDGEISRISKQKLNVNEESHKSVTIREEPMSSLV